MIARCHLRQHAVFLHPTRWRFYFVVDGTDPLVQFRLEITDDVDPDGTTYETNELYLFDDAPVPPTGTGVDQGPASPNDLTTE